MKLFRPEKENNKDFKHFSKDKPVFNKKSFEKPQKMVKVFSQRKSIELKILHQSQEKREKMSQKCNKKRAKKMNPG